MERLVVQGENETRKLGLLIAGKVKAGDVIALTGGLGMGKTTLARYIAEGLGVEEYITSPTFLIIKEYKSGRLPLYHFDVYRLSGEEDMYELGYEEYFYGDGVCIVEWADKVAGLIPKGSIVIRLTRGSGEFERVIEIDGI